VLLGTEWNPRALIRAQLIEEGFEVVATDSWAMMRRYLRPGSKPRLALVDLQSLPDPETVLDGLKTLMRPDAVLVLTAMHTLPEDAIRRRGFAVLQRPLDIRRIVETVIERMGRRAAGGGSD
jgi:hypothetical protein